MLETLQKNRTRLGTTMVVLVLGSLLDRFGPRPRTPLDTYVSFFFGILVGMSVALTFPVAVEKFVRRLLWGDPSEP
jgi:hypothetical protein